MQYKLLHWYLIEDSAPGGVGLPSRCPRLHAPGEDGNAGGADLVSRPLPADRQLDGGGVVRRRRKEQRSLGRPVAGTVHVPHFLWSASRYMYVQVYKQALNKLKDVEARRVSGKNEGLKQFRWQFTETIIIKVKWNV